MRRTLPPDVNDNASKRDTTLVTSTPGQREPTLPDPDLYPDLIAAGGLAEAIRHVAADLAIDLGDIPRNDWAPFLEAEIPSPTPDRSYIRVNIGKDKRRFILNGSLHSVPILRGSTSELTVLVKAAAGWQTGMTLRGIERIAPCLDISELDEAHERGPAEAVQARWNIELGMCDGGPDGFRELLEAAYAEPKLRQLYPVSSHWTLHFSRSTGDVMLRDVPFVDPVRGGRYRVNATTGDVIGEADTAQQAVAMVVAALPPDCGPATIERP
jgi:hypothetical protein